MRCTYTRVIFCIIWYFYLLLISHSYDDKNPAALYEAAAIQEMLVPIRLDIDIEGQKLRDTFTWNKSGKGERERERDRQTDRERERGYLVQFLIFGLAALERGRRELCT